jgi:5'-methylthioadenosine phosphorylase
MTSSDWAHPSRSVPPRADLGLIGGSGFYEFFEDAERVRVDTPFGAPSDDLVIGEVGGRRVAFIARHGQGHRLPPHLVNYRANLWALRSVGVRQVLSPCAVGSLRPELGPGTIVVPDQVVDRTWGREHSVYAEPGQVVHVGFAEPFCPRGRPVAVAAGRAAHHDVAESGTLVVINGPRFSSRAESAWHQQAGWSIVGMTAMPEAAIARELAMCFTTIALVTDHDAGVDGGQAVTHEEVLAVFARNVDGLKQVLWSALGAMPEPEADETASCSCRRALDGVTLPFALPG